MASGIFAFATKTKSRASPPAKSKSVPKSCFQPPHPFPPKLTSETPAKFIECRRCPEWKRKSRPCRRSTSLGPHSAEGPDGRRQASSRRWRRTQIVCVQPRSTILCIWSGADRFTRNDTPNRIPQTLTSMPLYRQTATQR